MFDLTGPGGTAGERVYVADELDRCLHTMLTTRLVEDFLATCGPETRKQLLFTMHYLLLRDQSLMRRDEMYIAQRDMNGCSELVELLKWVRDDARLKTNQFDIMRIKAAAENARVKRVSCSADLPEAGMTDVYELVARLLGE